MTQHSASEPRGLNEITRGELSINSYIRRFNEILRDANSQPADYATVSHYYLLGIMPCPAGRAILAARKRASRHRSRAPTPTPAETDDATTPPRNLLAANSAFFQPVKRSVTR